MLGPGRQQRADAAHRRPNQRCLSGLQGTDLFQQHPGCHPLQKDGGGLLVTDGRGQRHDAGGGASIVRRVGAAAGIGDPVAGPDMADALADLLDDACTFRARNEGQRHLVEAGAVIGVDEVHAHRCLPHEHLAGTGRARGKVFHGENFGPAGLMHANGIGIGKGHRALHCLSGKVEPGAGRPVKS